MNILGISCYYHDSAACLVQDGAIVAAAQEERFTRKKHDSGFPSAAIRYCLQQAGIKLCAVDHVVFYDKPLLKFERLLETYLAFAPRGFASFRKALPVWLKEKLLLRPTLAKAFLEIDPDFDVAPRLLFSEHHLSHAASAFFPSPFEEALVLTLDGVGEWTTTSLAIGRSHTLEIVREIHFPHSLGLLYSAFTYYCGFKVNSGEYKLMGLAPYGEPKYADLIYRHLIDVKSDGSFRLNMDYFEYCTGLTMTGRKFDELFGQPARVADRGELTQFHMDVAASVQAVTEEVLLRLCSALAAEFDIKNLCLAGGVALNCVANGKIAKTGKFNLWIQPAAGDAGGALGAALCGYHLFAKGPRHVARPCVAGGVSQDAMHGSFLGPEFTQDEIDAQLTSAGAVFEVIVDTNLFETVAAALAAGQAIGWFQGRMEFGPRALGNRSIIGDARSTTMQRSLNLKVKFRESFRPFAPSVLREDVGEWFEFDGDSPYMLIVSGVRADKRRAMNAHEAGLFGIEKLNIARSSIPAVTHVDYSARIQTVSRKTNDRYYRLIEAFKKTSGCPVIVNTSFNVRGEPIVCTPEDAFRCFMGTDLDMLVVGNAVMHKTRQTVAAKDYTRDYALD